MTMPPLVLTTGEPAGVGPELTVQLLQRPLPSPLVIAGDPELLLERAALLSLPLARKGDVLVVWKLDRLGRDLKHLVTIVQELTDREIGLRVLTGQGAQIDTTTAAGRLIFGIFAALAEFERELIRERTVAGLKAARARGRKGGRKFALTKAQVRLAQAAMSNRDTSVAQLAKELGVKPVTIYRYVGPNGELRENGRRVLAA